MKTLFTTSILLLLISINLKAHDFLAEGFAIQKVTDEFEQVTNMEIDHLGRIYLGQREGFIHLVEEGKPSILVIDIENEVDNMGDQGLMNIELDPNFKDNGYIYLLYFTDLNYVRNFGTPAYDPNFDYFGPSIHRLTRFTLDVNTNFTTIVPESKKVLIGTNENDGVAQLASAHGCGAIEFGTDGSILVSFGDASTYEGIYAGLGPPYYGEFVTEALNEGLIEEKEELGSFRAQLVDNMNGKVLRVHPETGAGLSTNPFFDEENPRAARSRVWALGMRNPFRMSVKPSSGSTNINDGKPGVIIVGDVGNSNWEEINIIDDKGQNFGWPIFEGIDNTPDYFFIDRQNLDAPNPLFNVSDCEQEYFNFQDLIAQSSLTPSPLTNPCNTDELIPNNIPTFQHKLPSIMFPHLETVGPITYVPAYDNNGNVFAQALEDQTAIENDGSFIGYASIGGDFYEGETWPETYHQGYFHADYAEGWIRFFAINDLNEITKSEKFFESELDIVDIQYSPLDECLYFVNFTWETSEIYKICYGLNPPPNAIIDTDIYYGDSPLLVQFNGTDSYDPLGEEITFNWNFGDGNTAEGENASHTFTTNSNEPTSFTATLSVTDSEGNIGTATKIISLNNTPPNVKITSIPDNYKYSLAGKNVVDLVAEVYDNEHTNEQLTYSWQTILHHDTHAHPEPKNINQTTSTLLDPVGCDGSVYYYEIVHTVTDPTGLSAQDIKLIYPDCDVESFISLGLFSAKAERNNIILKWLTLEENDVSHFEIQKSSNGTNWKNIATVNANSPSLNQEYSIVDLPESETFNIYRLRMVSNTGVRVYSNQAQVFYATLPKIHIYPNPATTTININFEKVDPNAQLFIYNNSGKKVYEKEYNLNNSSTAFIDEINTSLLNSGIYFIQLINNNETYSQKLVIE